MNLLSSSIKFFNDEANDKIRSSNLFQEATVTSRNVNFEGFIAVSESACIFNSHKNRIGNFVISNALRL